MNVIITLTVSPMNSVHVNNSTVPTMTAVWWYRARGEDRSAAVGAAAPVRNNTTREESLLFYCCANWG